MESRFGWISSTCASIKTGFSQMVTYAGTKAHDLYYSKTLSDHTSNIFKQSVQGVSQPILPDNLVALTDNKKTRRALLSSYLPNIMYGATVIVKAVGVKHTLQQLPYVGSVVESADFLARQIPGVDFALDAADALAWMYLIYKFTDIKLDMFVGAANIAAVAAKDKPDNNPFEKCGHKASDQIYATIASPVYYAVNFAVVEYVLPHISYLNYLYYPASSLLYGEALLEYLQGGSCANCRYTDKPFWFALSLGGSYQLRRAAINFGIKYLTGVDNILVDMTVMNMITLYDVASIHLVKIPITRKHYSVDFFYPLRAATDWVLAKSRNMVSSLWYSAEESDLGVACRYVIETKPVLAMRTHTYQGSFLSVENLIHRPTVTFFLNSQEKMVREWIVWLQGIRMMPYIDEVLTITEYLEQYFKAPKLLTDNKGLLKFLLDDSTRSTMTMMHEFMLHMNLKKALKKPQGRLLTDAEKQTISLAIDKEMKRLNSVVKVVDEERLASCNNKITILKVLLKLIDKTNNDTELDVFLRTWYEVYQVEIHRHRHLLSWFYKQTDTAQLFAELSRITQLPKSKEINKKVLMKEKINEKLDGLEAELVYINSDEYVHTEKMNALTKLDGIINDERYQQLDFNNILVIWKKYYWHFIIAHRSLTTILKNKLGSQVGYEAENPLTAKFLQALVDSILRPVLDVPKLAPVQPLSSLSSVVSIFKKAPVISSASSLGDKPKILQRLEAQINRLRGESDFAKLRALAALKNDVVTDYPDKPLVDILIDWKKTYWRAINTARHPGLDKVKHFFTSAVGEKTAPTELATFIEKLMSEYASEKLQQFAYKS